MQFLRTHNEEADRTVDRIYPPKYEKISSYPPNNTPIKILLKRISYH